MAANSQIAVTQLDFDQIAAGLKSYLRSQTRFQDYNFEGSNLSVLINLLAYAAYNDAFYTNMIANELFLDTALLRDSVVSRAKELNYTPRSVRGAQASLRVTVVPDDSPSSITIPRATKFQTQANNETYTFQTETDYTMVPVNGSYAANVDVYEGVEVTERFPVTTTSRYILLNSKADTSSLSVTVQTSNTDLTTFPYQLADDINAINGQSRVYYLQETEGERFEIYFGDGVLGRQLSVGNIVIARYRIANGSRLNGANTFTAVSTISGYNNITVTTTSPATGGSDLETIESIKFSAPKQYEIQGRLVTARDYERTVLSENPDITSISVWGGQDNVPPRYGYVFVSAKPSVGTRLSTSRKETIATQLRSRNVVGTEIEFVDPMYMYINLTVAARYNPGLTSKTAGQVQTTVLNAISSFETTSLSSFNKVFRLSRFQRAIDNSDPSILSNETLIELELRNDTITTAQPQDVTFQFNQAIDDEVGSVSSSTFTFGGKTCYLRDTETDTIEIVYNAEDNAVTVINDNVGTVDRASGVVTLTSFQPSAITSGTIAVRVIPVNKEVRPIRNQILLFGTKTIGITPEVDQLALTTGQY